MEKYTYLAINFFSVLVPFIFSFHPRLNFYKQWKFYFPATLISASLFIAWDILYTYLGVWDFNPRYVTGVFISGLPIEEILFFLCIPYASIFSYYCFNMLIQRDFFKAYQDIISYTLIILLLIVGIFHFQQLYTGVTCIAAAIFIFFVKEQPWFSRYIFAYIILLIPFMIVNGLLTGTGLDEAVVRYNPTQFMGYRILTIPVEDTAYGFLLLGLNAYLFEYFSEKKAI
jgi:lycopene cyclase domain-containing protein